ncbi:MAG TPA: hypothetical protein VF796_22780, partial [Humisphaera sp.]
DALWLVDRPVAAMRRGLGRATAVSLLSAWDAFGRFSRDCVGVEPLVLARAWRALADDPAAEALAGYPEAAVDAELAGHWHRSLSGPWGKRFDD